jgi:organic radical activating enzyme
MYRRRCYIINAIDGGGRYTMWIANYNGKWCYTYSLDMAQRFRTRKSAEKVINEVNQFGLKIQTEWEE